MPRRTKIICTLGPASQSTRMIYKLAKAGMDVARLNFSHGNHGGHKKVIERIRKVNKRLRRKIKILQDLEGYRIRLGHLSNPVVLKKKQRFLIRGINTQYAKAIPLDCDFNLELLKKRMHLFIADGSIDCKVIGHQKDMVLLEVLQGGTISSKKGVNIPGLRLQVDILTLKDEKDIIFGIKHKVDFIAQSFVRNKDDILRVIGLVKPHLAKCRVIAKIENQEGVNNIKGILKACDGIMVARGDLGVSLPIYEVPVMQKKIIGLSNRLRKIDITATQMLETMTTNYRPTRAEVSDIANAVFDGSDYLMLSAETAVGKFPVEAVNMMRQVIEFTEKNMKA